MASETKPAAALENSKANGTRGAEGASGSGVDERQPAPPKFFDAWQFKAICALCESIIPPDEDCEGAAAAGAPEFIDLLASEDSKAGILLSLGLQAVDALCVAKYGARYLECFPLQQAEVLDLIAYRENAKADESLEPAIKCFALLRQLTVGAFFTSKIGIGYLRYIGNEYLKEFPGCAVPEGWPAAAVRQPKEGKHG